MLRRGVAFAAMGEGLGKVRAAVPVGALRRVGPEPRVGVEEARPDRHQPALIEREGEGVPPGRSMNRWKAEEVGLDRQGVGVGHVGVAGERHRRIEPGAVAPHPAVHSDQEFGVAVGADARLPIGGDVGGVERPERQGKGEAAGERLAAPRRVADQAIGRPREVLAPLHLARVGQSGGNARRIGAAIVGQRHLAATRESHRAWAADDPQAYRRADRDDDREADDDTAPQAHAFFLPASTSRSTGNRRRAMPVAA